MSRNRIELTGTVACTPEVRTTPTGMPVVKIEVDCGEGRESLRLEVVMAGEAARELGARLGAGATVRVTGALRPVQRRARSGIVLGGVEVVASAIDEVPAGTDR
jgi:primosomal replication protein N